MNVIVLIHVFVGENFATHILHDVAVDSFHDLKNLISHLGDPSDKYLPEWIRSAIIAFDPSQTTLKVMQITGLEKLIEVSRGNWLVPGSGME